MSDTGTLRAAVRPSASPLTTGAEAEVEESAESPCVSAPHSAVPARHAGRAVLRGPAVQKDTPAVWRNSGRSSIRGTQPEVTCRNCYPPSAVLAGTSRWWKTPCQLLARAPTLGGRRSAGAKLVGQDARSGMRNFGTVPVAESMKLSDKRKQSGYFQKLVVLRFPQ
jgi:hypothetical protein